MGSSFMRLGKTVVREGFEQISKQLTKEQPNVAGKILGGLDNTTKNLLSKEIADYPPSAKTLKDIMRNHPEDFPVYIRQLKGQKVDKQTANGIQEIANKANKPEVAAKAAAVEVPDAPILKREITGLEGRELRDARTGLTDEFVDWLNSEPNLIDDIIAKKRKRSEFAEEGIFINGEEYRFGGIEKYKAGKGRPYLKLSKQSVSDKNRGINAAIQTLGPKMKPKPEVLDIFNKVVPPGDVHKHHVLILKVMEPFFMTLDSAGNRVPRSEKQRIAIMKAIQAQGWFTGDLDENMIWQSARAHQRAKGSSHDILRMFSDIQGRGVGEVFEEGYGATKLSGTYDPKAVHGFSEEHLNKLLNLKDAQSVTNALLMFLEESGAGEFMKGAAHIGSKTYDKVGPGNVKHMENFAAAGKATEKAIGKLKKAK